MRELPRDNYSAFHLFRYPYPPGGKYQNLRRTSTPRPRWSLTPAPATATRGSRVGRGSLSLQVCLLVLSRKVVVVTWEERDYVACFDVVYVLVGQF